MTNYFDQAAERQTAAPVKAQWRAQERRAVKKPPMKPTAMEKEFYDKARQMRLYLRWKREIRDKIKSGEYAANVVELFRLLRNVAEPDRILVYIRGSEWLHQASENTRYNILHMISRCMIRHNIRNGYPSFTDALPGQPDTPYQQVRKMLMGV